MAIISKFPIKTEEGVHNVGSLITCIDTLEEERLVGMGVAIWAENNPGDNNNSGDNNNESIEYKALLVMSKKELSAYATAVGATINDKDNKDITVKNILEHDDELLLEALSDEALQIVAKADGIETENKTREEIIEALAGE